MEEMSMKLLLLMFFMIYSDVSFQGEKYEKPEEYIIPVYNKYAQLTWGGLGIYISGTMQQYLCEQGIEYQARMLSSPQQNSTAGRKNPALTQKIRKWQIHL